jgi:hypothetical protein
LVKLIVTGFLLVTSADDPSEMSNKETSLTDALITLFATLSPLLALLIKPIRNKVVKYLNFLVNIDAIMSQIEAIKTQNEQNLKETKELINIANKMAVAQAERDAEFSQVVKDMSEFTTNMKAMDNKISQLKDSLVNKISEIQQRLSKTEGIVEMMKSKR